MAALVPAIHAWPAAKTWMPGTRPDMTVLMDWRKVQQITRGSALLTP
jgi:hypothetical protein